MSRVAKKPIHYLNSGVDVSIENQTIKMKSPKGALEHVVHPTVMIEQQDNVLTFAPKSPQDTWALSGTTRALVSNMLEGLSKGYSKELELVGVGYRVKQEGNQLHFTLGYSHPIVYTLPEAVTAVVDKQVNLTLTSYDKHALGQCAANIIKLRKPDAYKGKGVRVKGKLLKLKEVKKK